MRTALARRWEQWSDQKVPFEMGSPPSARGSVEMPGDGDQMAVVPTMALGTLPPQGTQDIVEKATATPDGQEDRDKEAEGGTDAPSDQDHGPPTSLTPSTPSQHSTDKAGQWTERDDYPDGGYQAWASVLGCSLAMFVSFGLFVGSSGTYQARWSQHELLGYSQSAIAWISSIQLLFIYCCGLFVGPLFDLGYYRHMLASSIVLFVFAQMMVSLCTEFYQFILAQGIGLGIAQGVIFNTCAVIPMQWFLKKRAFVTALVVSSSSLGGCLWPIAISRLFNQIGFPWTMRFVGFLSMALLAISFVTVRTRLPPRGRPKGQSLISTAVDLDALRYPPFMALAVGMVLMLLCFYIPYQFVPIYATERRFGILGSDFISILNATSTVGRVLPSMLADKIGRINVFIPCAFLTGFLVLLLPLVTSTAGMVVYCIGYAIAAGSFIGLFTSVTAQLGPVSRVGARIGLIMGVVSIPALVSSPIIGALIGTAERGYRWWPACIFGGVCGMAGSGCMMLCRYLAGKDSKTWRI